MAIVAVYLRGGVDSGGSDYRGAIGAVLVLTVGFLWTAGLASGAFDSLALGNAGLAVLLETPATASHWFTFLLLPLKFALLPVEGGALLGTLILVVLLGIAAAGLIARSTLGVAASWIVLSCVSITLLGAPDAGPTRYLYVPWAATCLLVPWLVGMSTSEKLRPVLGAAAALAILLSAAFTFQRCGLWSDPIRVWSQEQEAHPESMVPPEAIGRYAMTQLGRLTEAGDGSSRVVAQQARTAWERTLELDPQSWEARKNLGILAMEEGEGSTALEHFRFVSERLPVDKDALMYRAIAAEQESLRTGDAKLARESMRIFRRAHELGPLPAAALQRYGMLAIRMGNLAAGLDALRKAMATSPSDELKAAIDNYAEVEGQLDTLNQQAEAALRNAPQSAGGLVLRAQRNMLEGRTLDAFYVLQMAAKREPANAGAWALLGVVSAQLDGTSNFLEQWGNAPAANPASWKQLSMRCGVAGLWPATEEYMRGAARLHGESIGLPEVALADVALELNQAPRAVAYLQAAQKAYPSDPVPWLRLAEMAIQSEKLAEARALLNGARERNADPETLKALMEKLGPAGNVREGVTRTIIR